MRISDWSSDVCSSDLQMEYLLKGLGWTIILSLISFVLGSAGGFGVMLARVSRFGLVRFITAVFIQIIQRIPLLVLLLSCISAWGFSGSSFPHWRPQELPIWFMSEPFWARSAAAAPSPSRKPSRKHRTA